MSPRLQPRITAQGPVPDPRQAPPRRRGRFVLLALLVVAGLIAAFMLGSRSGEGPASGGGSSVAEPVTGGQGAIDDPAAANDDPQEAGTAAGGDTTGSEATGSDATGSAATGSDATGGGGPSAAPGGAASAAEVMPSVVGMVLQDAQDLLQSQGSYLMDQMDATGAGRMQIFDSNWKVCSQKPAAGETLSAITIVTLGTVKLDESCP